MGAIRVRAAAGVLFLASLGSAASAGDPSPPLVEGRTVAEWIERSKGEDVDAVTQAIRVLSSEAVHNGPEAGEAAFAIAALFESPRWDVDAGEKGVWVRRIAIDSLASFREKGEAAVMRLGARARGAVREFIRRVLGEDTQRYRFLLGRTIETKVHRTKSIDDIRTMINLFIGDGVGVSKPWPPFNGKRLVLWLVATNKLDRENNDNLSILFSAADATRSLEKAGGRAAYKSVTLPTLQSAEVDARPLTSYVGRRNADADTRIRAVDLEIGAPIIADVSFEDGAVVGFTDGSAKWLTREDLGIPAGKPIAVGPDSPSPILRLFSDR